MSGRKKPLIRVLSRRLIYQGRVIRLVQERLNVEGISLVRETVVHPGAVVVVPILPNRRVLLVRQYRRSIARKLLELPAGTRDKKREPPLICARRELLEETGWNAGCMRRLGVFYSAPGFTSEQMILYLAWKLTPGLAHPEADERLTPVILAFDEALAQVFNGSIQDGKTIIGLLLARQVLERRRGLV
jgi:ADP-ribose pyrophosphatase